uniref:Transposase n=1 Tax=Heterorhabditis bacteriophora TaxID=37862 RepID=A0A1I7W7Y5_HETBA
MAVEWLHMISRRRRLGLGKGKSRQLSTMDATWCEIRRSLDGVLYYIPTRQREEGSRLFGDGPDFG